MVGHWWNGWQDYTSPPSQSLPWEHRRAPVPMATLLPLPLAFSPRCPVSLAAYSVESRLPVSLPLEPFLSRSLPLRTMPTMLALAALYLSRTPALYRAACVSTLLAPPLLLSLPLAAVPFRHCAALFCLPSLSPHPTTGLPAVLPSRPLQTPLAPRSCPPRFHLQPVDAVRSRLRRLVATGVALHVRQRLVPRRLLAACLPLLLRLYRRTGLLGRPRWRLPERALGLRPLSPPSTPFFPLPRLVSLPLPCP